MINHDAFKKLTGMTVEESGAAIRHELRVQDWPKVHALLSAGWSFELPEIPDAEPMSWYWRRPARRKGSKGMKFLSTDQAFNHLQRNKK